MKKELNKNELKLTNGGVALRAEVALSYLNDNKARTNASLYNKAKLHLEGYMGAQFIVIPLIAVPTGIYFTTPAGAEISKVIEGCDPNEYAKYVLESKAID